jgi:threonine synthase
LALTITRWPWPRPGPNNPRRAAPRFLFPALQIVYYFHAYAQFRTLVGQPHGYPPVVFCVPTGNFGDVLAGFYAKRMGLPIAKLVIATNENDIVVRVAAREAGLGRG